MKTGVLGGTFDPPHTGHLVVAQDAWTALELDRLLFVPAAAPPHKPGGGVSPAELRMAMLRAALAGDSRFEADDVELRRSGPSYTVDTLRALRERDPGGELVFLMGTDQLDEFHTWREPREVARLATLVVVSRGGRPAESDLDVDYDVLEATRVDLSSTEVRRRVRAGEPIRYLVPDAVREIIEADGLYRT